MADTDSVPWRAPGVRAGYPDLPYDVELLGRHFVAVNNMWQLCYLLADYRVPHPPLPRSSDTERMAAKQRGSASTSHSSEVPLPSPRLPDRAGS